MERAGYNDAVFTCCEEDISISILRNVLYLLAEIRPRPSQALKVNKSVYVAYSGQQHEITINNSFLHVLNHALKRFVINFAKNAFNKTTFFETW